MRLREGKEVAAPQELVQSEGKEIRLGDEGQPRRFTIIVKPTTACNLACSYCYVDPDEEKLSMNEKTLTSLISKTPNLVTRGGEVRIIWHGGEPMLMGVQFYKKALELEESVQKQDGITITNSMQSNLTLVDEEFARFLGENEFRVGTSIDGPRELHNKTRAKPRGAGSFDDVLKGLDIMKRYQNCIGAICVLTKYNRDHVEEIYNLFKALGMGFKLNPLINSARVRRRTDLGISATDYFNALRQLFDIWYNDTNPAIHVNTLGDEVIESLLAGYDNLCCYGERDCQEKFFSIYPNGDVHPCGRFGDSDLFNYGNINWSEMRDIMGSEKRAVFLRRRETLNECKACPETSICHGGCPHNAYEQYGTINAKDPYCSSRKSILNYVRRRIEKDLAEAVVEVS